MAQWPRFTKLALLLAEKSPRNNGKLPCAKGVGFGTPLNTAFSGEIRFHAKRSEESVAKYTSSVEQRVAFRVGFSQGFTPGVVFGIFVISGK